MVKAVLAAGSYSLYQWTPDVIRLEGYVERAVANRELQPPVHINDIQRVLT